MSSSQPPRTELLLNLLSQRIAILDGAMGTMVHALGFDEAGFRGKPFQDHQRDLKNCIDVLTLSQPEAIRQIHTSFLDAGADIIETNTFNSNAPSMADYGMESIVTELNATSARRRSEERRVGKECVNPCRSRWSPYH